MKKTVYLLFMIVIVTGCRKDVTRILNDKDPKDGSIYLSPFSAGDNSGQLLVLDKNGNQQEAINTPGAAVNFEKWNINGKTRYSWLVETSSGFHIPNFTGYLPGYEVVADENMNELQHIYLHSHDNLDASVQKLLDAHDFVLLGDSDYIVEAYYEKQVQNIPAGLNAVPTVTVVAPIIQEIRDNQVVWQWDGTEHPELYAESVEGNNFSSTTAINDYLHINSMTLDPADGNLVCSFRNANMILKIDRNSGDIIWKLGGKNSDFPMTADQKFLRQHHVTFTDNGNTLMIFDNGEATERPYTRIDEMQLDEGGRQITGFKSVNIPGDFVQYMGSVQKIDDRYFIGGGTSKYVLEFNYNTGEIFFKMQLAKNTYRAFKY
jgi:arylsulfate sulfotransferase